ncbi:MAG TPA: DUF6702 family protein [Cyclobacteriaceae bacterium]|nr:DUF6702 family protein [Cyclobacteriaceae bacterium]
MPVIPVFLLSVLIFFHPLHISVTEMVWDEKEKELEIMLRIFTDDLELAIRNAKQDDRLNVLTASKTTIDALAWEYLQPRLALAVDGKGVPLKYLGHEAAEDVLVFYIQVQPVKKIATIDITNAVLTEYYDDQANIVNVTVNTKTKSLRLVRNNPSGSLSFELK